MGMANTAPNTAKYNWLGYIEYIELVELWQVLVLKHHTNNYKLNLKTFPILYLGGFSNNLCTFHLYNISVNFASFQWLIVNTLLCVNLSQYCVCSLATTTSAILSLYTPRLKNSWIGANTTYGDVSFKISSSVLLSHTDKNVHIHITHRCQKTVACDIPLRSLQQKSLKRQYLNWSQQ